MPYAITLFFSKEHYLIKNNVLIFSVILEGRRIQRRFALIPRHKGTGLMALILKVGFIAHCNNIWICV
jgi:hypothetical protein